MSWPSTDFELEIQNELDILRKIAQAAIALTVNVSPDGYTPELLALIDALNELGTFSTCKNF